VKAHVHGNNAHKINTLSERACLFVCAETRTSFKISIVLLLLHVFDYGRDSSLATMKFKTKLLIDKSEAESSDLDIAEAVRSLSPLPRSSIQAEDSSTSDLDQGMSTKLPNSPSPLREYWPVEQILNETTPGGNNNAFFVNNRKFTIFSRWLQSLSKQSH